MLVSRSGMISVRKHWLRHDDGAHSADFSHEVWEK